MKTPGKRQLQPDQPFIGFGDPLLSEGKGSNAANLWHNSSHAAG